MSKGIGSSYYRLCSCGARIMTKHTIGAHRKRGHTVPIKHYSLKGVFK